METLIFNFRKAYQKSNDGFDRIHHWSFQSVRGRRRTEVREELVDLDRLKILNFQSISPRDHKSFMSQLSSEIVSVQKDEKLLRKKKPR
mgnify:CR=1 FL=1